MTVVYWKYFSKTQLSWILLVAVNQHLAVVEECLVPLGYKAPLRSENESIMENERKTCKQLWSSSNLQKN